MGMILRIASSRKVGQGDIVGRSGYFSLNLSANSVMRGRLDARRTLKSLVADLRIVTKKYIARGKSGSFEIELPALNASVIVELPSGMKLRSVDGRIVTKDNHVISYK